MRAKRPKIPTPGPLSSTLTTASGLASVGDALGLVHEDSAAALDVGAPVEDVGEAVAACTGTAAPAGAGPPWAAGANGRGWALVAEGFGASDGTRAAGFGIAGAGAGAVKS